MKKMVHPLLPKCSNFQITDFSPALEKDFESIFVSGGYNQGGRGLDHFASEPFIIDQLSYRTKFGSRAPFLKENTCIC